MFAFLFLMTIVKQLYMHLKFLSGLVDCGLDCEFLVGQGYDGAINMSGKVPGVKSIFKLNIQKLFMYTVLHIP